MKLSETAWKTGFVAGAAGVPVTRCPAPAGAVDSWSWHSGYIEGKAKTFSPVKQIGSSLTLRHKGCE